MCIFSLPGISMLIIKMEEGERDILALILM